MKRKIRLTGIWWIFFAAMFWSAQGVLGKANSWHPISLTAIRSIFATIIIGTYRRSFRLSKEKYNWIAAVFVGVTGLLFVSANSLTTAANAIVIQYVMPVFVMVISLVIWHKKISCSDLMCSAVMLVGVTICFMSGLSSGIFLGNMLALISALTYAIVYLSARAEGCDVLTYTYQGCLLCMLLLGYIPFDASFVIDFANVASAAAMGIFVGLGYICFSRGFLGDISPTKASVISYIEPVLNPVWVMIFIGESVSLVSAIGIVVVLTTAIIYSIKNSK